MSAGDFQPSVGDRTNRRGTRNDTRAEIDVRGRARKGGGALTSHGMGSGTRLDLDRVPITGQLPDSCRRLFICDVVGGPRLSRSDASCGTASRSPGPVIILVETLKMVILKVEFKVLDLAEF